MPDVILLTQEQCDGVKGPSAVDPNHVIDPVPLNDGTYILGTEVLLDPMHAQHYEALKTMPLVDYDSLADKLVKPEEPAP